MKSRSRHGLYHLGIGVLRPSLPPAPLFAAGPSVLPAVVAATATATAASLRAVILALVLAPATVPLGRNVPARVVLAEAARRACTPPAAAPAPLRGLTRTARLEADGRDVSGVDVVEAIVREDVELALALGRVDTEASEAGALCSVIGAR